MPPLSFAETTPSSILRDAEYTPTRKALIAASTALLIVDVQGKNRKAFSRSWKRDFPGFPEKLQTTISHCRSANAKIIWVVPEKANHSIQNSQLSSFNGRSRKRRKVCSHEVAQQLEMVPTPQRGDIVVKKQGLSGTSDTQLLQLLRKHNIDTVLMCGLWTSVSVQHTAFKVFERGFRTLLVHDACADWKRARHEAAISLYGNYMYELVESSDLEPTTNNMHGLWHSLPSFPVVVSDSEIAEAHDSFRNTTLLYEDKCEERSIVTATEVPNASSSSGNPSWSPVAFPTELQSIATIQQRVALSTR